MVIMSSAWVIETAAGPECGNCGHGVGIWLAPDERPCNCVWRQGYKDGLAFKKNNSTHYTTHYTKDDDRQRYLSGYYTGRNAIDRTQFKYPPYWTQSEMFITACTTHHGTNCPNCYLKPAKN